MCRTRPVHHFEPAVERGHSMMMAMMIINCDIVVEGTTAERRVEQTEYIPWFTNSSSSPTAANRLIDQFTTAVHSAQRITATD